MLSHALPSHWRTGGIFRSNISSVETYDQKQVFDSFFERGILCLKPESARTSSKQRSLVLFLVTCV